MKDLLFKKILLVPFLVTGIFALFLCGCEKDKDSEGESLAVTVNFTGSLVPEVGDVLSIVVFNTKISELDVDSNIVPDICVDVVLTRSDIDNGVTVNLDTIDLDKPQIYIGALVDMDNESGPSSGDLVEFFEDVDIIDALLDVAQPTNCHGLNSVAINLDKVMTLPSLDVTVNFTGTKVPSVDDELMLVLYYSPLSEILQGTVTVGDMLFHTLTSDDIANGTTLTFTGIDPFAAEIYIVAFVDSDGDRNPGDGELMECYQDVEVFKAWLGEANATNVAGETAITVDLDKILTMPSLAVTVNFTGTKVPLADDELMLELYYYPLSMSIGDPDETLSHILTADDITNGITLTFTDLDPFATEIYVVAFIVSDDDDPLAECYRDVDVYEVWSEEANATNVAGETLITIDLDLILKNKIILK
ncbi:MAG: hypothetical protein ACOX5K_00815 [Bacteroidales bacterium]